MGLGDSAADLIPVKSLRFMVKIVAARHGFYSPLTNFLDRANHF